MTNIPIKLDYSYLDPEVTAEELKWWQPAINIAHEQLHHGTGAGNDFLGWMEPAKIMPAELLSEIKNVAENLKKSADIMVVIGIGGSYLGARTVIEALAGKDAPEVIYAGQTLSADYTAWLLNYLADKRFCINVVSKSGTTTEPAVAFRLLKNLLEKNVGKDAARKLIIASTDPDSGALRKMSNDEGYVTFPIPQNVGGRYSVFTAVGMLPVAFAGIDVDAFINGAINCAVACAAEKSIEKNPEAAIKIIYKMVNIIAGRLESAGAFLSDIVQWGEKARKRAITDEYTGLYNRRFFDDSIKEHFSKTKESNSILSLVMLDLDHFGTLNKEYGQKTGDEAILTASSIFKDSFRASDILVRFGGDEFIFIMRDTDSTAALMICNDVVEKLRGITLENTEGKTVTHITGSIGIASFPEHADKLEVLIESADKAVYQAKEAGRNCAIIFTP